MEQYRCAAKYRVGFLLTEVGTDTEDLSLKEYEAYEAEWLKTLKANNIPWMWNCVENVVAAKERLWPNQIVKQSVIKNIKGTPLYANTTITDFIKCYN